MVEAECTAARTDEPTRYFYDCEFLEDGKTIELISIGIVDEDGRSFYAVNRDFRWRRIARRRWYAPWSWRVRQPWLVANVVPGLPNLHGDARLLYGNDGPFGIVDWRDRAFMRHEQIAMEVEAFLTAPLRSGRSDTIELWADYGAYDHVVLCQLWGRMIDLPPGLPMFTRDFQQEVARAENPPLPNQTVGVHNALADARHLRLQHRALETGLLAAEESGR